MSMDYTILAAYQDGDPQTKQIEQQVKKHIREGWQPLGAPFFGGSVMYQAMVKPQANQKSSD